MAKGKDLKARIFAFIAIAKAKKALKEIANLPKPMVYQGTVGEGGDVSDLPLLPNVGDTYIVVSNGTYGGYSARIGDIFVAKDNAWTHVPSGDIDTWRNIYVNGTEVQDITNKDALKLAQGSNIALTFDASTKTISIAVTGLASVATSGDYNDLNNLPTIPAEQVQSDWNETDTTSKDYIKNKPTVAQIDDTTTSATALWSSSKINTAKENKHKKIPLTLTAGQSTLTFTDASILADSLIDVHAPIWYISNVQTAGSVVLTFPVQAVDMSVTIDIH